MQEAGAIGKLDESDKIQKKSTSATGNNEKNQQQMSSSQKEEEKQAGSNLINVISNIPNEGKHTLHADIEVQNERQERLKAFRVYIKERCCGFLEALKQKFIRLLLAFFQLIGWFFCLISNKFMKPLIAAWLLLQCVILIQMMYAVFGPEATSPEDLVKGIKGIITNLNARPIVDVILNGSRDEEEYDRLYLGKWPGTVPFCYDSGSIQTEFDVSKCSSHYKNISARVYTLWKSTKVYVKKLSLSSILYSFSCPPEYTECASGFCVEKGTDCGITEIHFENSPRNSAGWYSTRYNDTYVNYRKDIGVLPIVSLALVHGQPTLCVNADDGDQRNYNATAVSSHGCGRYGSFQNVTLIDTDSSINIFNSQPWGNLPMSLPKFASELESQNGYLMGISRLDIKGYSSCLEIDLNDAFWSIKIYYSVADYRWGLYTSLLIVLFGIAVFNLACDMRRDRGGHFNMAVLFFYLAACSGSVLLFTYLWGDGWYPGMVTFQNQLSSVKDSKCFTDSNAQQVLSDLMSTSLRHTKLRKLSLFYLLLDWAGVIYWFLIVHRP